MHDGYGMPELYEDQAGWQVGALYDDIKCVLGVPLVNLVFRVLGWYPEFLALAWQQMRPNMLTLNGELAASRLRLPDIKMYVPHIEWEAFCDAKTLAEVRCVISMFGYVNPKLLLIVSALAESLGERPIAGGTPVIGWATPGRLHWPPVRMVDVASAPPEIKPTLLDIARVHRSMDVASDFRVLANYPQFLNRAWEELRRSVGSPRWAMTVEEIKALAVRLARELPFPVTVDQRTLAQFYAPAPIAGVMGIVAQFQEILPLLIIDMAFLRDLLGSAVDRLLWAPN